MMTKKRNRRNYLNDKLFFEGLLPNLFLVFFAFSLFYFRINSGVVSLISIVIFLLGLINIIKWSFTKVTNKKTHYHSIYAILIAVLILAGIVFIIPIKESLAAYRNYKYGGTLYNQKGYYRSNGSYIQPHLKTKPDNTIYNNRKYILGY